MELKPCPFCGAKPYMAKNYLGQKYVRCPECGACVWGKDTDDWRIDTMGEKKAEKAAAEAWNRRASDELSKPRWIPVEEKLPRMWEEVMLRFPNNQAVGFHDGDSGWAVFSGDNLYTYVAPEEVHPTHWMPLPEPPKEEH